MPSAEIITIGTEMLLGQLVDTNTAVIARALADIGVDVRRETSVGDNEASIAAAVSEAIGRAEIVVCAGGLGPTVDDMTRGAIAAAVSRPLVCDPESLRHLQSLFARLKRPMTDNNAAQAYFPKDAEPLPNPNGSAPGFVVERDGRAVLALPGPPRELEPMLQDHAIPWIERRFAPQAVLVTRVLRTVGVGESDLDARIADLFREQKNPSIAVLAHPGLVDVKITAKAATREKAFEMIGTLEPLVRERLGDCVYALDGGTLESVAGELLLLHGWTIAVGESCTGGLLAAALTSIPGSSSYFRGGVVAYSNEAKRRLLDVAPELIELQGAVSEEVARAMALGAMVSLHADVGISITGVAGPDGGTAEKPVGLVYIGLGLPDGSTTIHRLDWPSSREGIQRRAVIGALSMLWRALR